MISRNDLFKRMLEDYPKLTKEQQTLTRMLIFPNAGKQTEIGTADKKRFPRGIIRELNDIYNKC
mgnify:CR=1 FL=1